MSTYHLTYAISDRTPPSSKALRAILEAQAKMNERLTWTHERLSLVPRRDAPRPLFAFPYVRFAPPRLVFAPGFGLQPGVAVLAPMDAYAVGTTKVRNNLWNAHLVAAFLRLVSARHPELLFELRDDGGFVLPAAVWIQGGKVDLNREWLNRERERALETFGTPDAASFFIWAETQGLEGRFFEKGNVLDYAEVPEIRQLVGANREQVESLSLEKAALIVADRAMKSAVPQVA